MRERYEQIGHRREGDWEIKRDIKREREALKTQTIIFNLLIS